MKKELKENDICPNKGCNGILEEIIPVSRMDSYQDTTQNNEECFFCPKCYRYFSEDGHEIESPSH